MESIERALLAPALQPQPPVLTHDIEQEEGEGEERSLGPHHMKVLMDVPQQLSEVSVPGEKLLFELVFQHTTVVQRM